MQYACQPKVVVALLLASGLGVAETVVLRNGFRLEIDRLEGDSENTRLLLSNGGWIEVPAGEILRVDPGSPPTDEIEAARGAPSDPERSATLSDEIDRLADRAGLPPSLVRAVVWAESGNREDAVSPKGAIGLMQLMPGTAVDLGVDPENPAENIEGGTLYLKQLLERYEGDQDQLAKALAAYNAGPGRVEEHGGLPPYPETVAYVAKVVRRFLATTRTRSQHADGEAAPE